jgi:RNA-directed DNA polymerase
LAGRLDDSARLRLVQKWRKAGVLDTAGQGRHPGTGTPHGGTVSPLLANGCLHYALDLGVEKVVKQPCRGEAGLLRYAAACVGAFAVQAEAERVYSMRGQRREKVGRELAAAKPRMLSCSRDRAAAQTSGEFLGGACRGGKDRQGHDHRNRRTARKQLRTSRNRCTAWGKAPRHLRLPVLFQRLNAQRRGDSNDDGVHGNAARLNECCNNAIRILLKGLNRRRQRPSATWHGDTAVLERFHVVRPRIVGRPKTRQAALTAAADLRKRVFLKSPVRENRTPGSVRRRSGHWPSYRDDLRIRTQEPHGESGHLELPQGVRAERGLGLPA